MNPHCRIARVRPKASPHLTVHVLDQPNLNDVPQMMERVAWGIRAGEYGDVLAGAMVLQNHGIQVFGWGSTDVVHATGLFSMAQHEMARISLAGDAA